MYIQGVIMFVNGPSDKNPANMNTQSSSANTPEQKKSGSIFDELFSKSRAGKILDTNQDGSISINEVSDYVKSSNGSDSITKFIGAFLGIKNGVSGTDLVLKIMDKLNILKRSDLDGDSRISNDEIKNAQSFESSVRNEFNEILGIADGKISNKQGSLGSCWVLSPSKALSDKGLLDLVLEVDDNYNVTVTLHGTEDENGKPYVYTFSRSQLMMRKSGSTDPDAVAMEAAFESYNMDLKARNEAVSKTIEEYVNASTPVMPEKPPVELLNSDISDEDWTKFFNYYNNSVSENKNSFIFASKLKYADDKEKMINDMKKYLEVSTPVMPEKPSIVDISRGFMSGKVYNYIQNSQSETVAKPEPKARLSAPNFTSGGDLHAALKYMFGDACEYTVYKNEETGQDMVESLLAKAQDSQTVLTVNFQNEDDSVITSHAYYLVKSDNKFVYLSNPHNSDAYIKYPKKDFMENYLQLCDVSINPENLEDIK